MSFFYDLSKTTGQPPNTTGGQPQLGLFGSATPSPEPALSLPVTAPTFDASPSLPSSTSIQDTVIETSKPLFNSRTMNSYPFLSGTSNFGTPTNPSTTNVQPSNTVGIAKTIAPITFGATFQVPSTKASTCFSLSSTTQTASKCFSLTSTTQTASTGFTLAGTTQPASTGFSLAGTTQPASTTGFSLGGTTLASTAFSVGTTPAAFTSYSLVTTQASTAFSVDTTPTASTSIFSFGTASTSSSSLGTSGTKKSLSSTIPITDKVTKNQDWYLKPSESNIFKLATNYQITMYLSYIISLRIVQTGNPYTIGESLILPAIKDAVGAMFDKNTLEEVDQIPLSYQTVSCRIHQISRWVEDKLIERVKSSKWFSLQLDVYSDVQGLSKLIVFVRYIWMNEVHEDFLFCKLVPEYSSSVIFCALNTYMDMKGIGWKKCVGLYIGCEPTKYSYKSSIITEIRKTNPNVQWVDFNIHRAALLWESLSKDFRTTLLVSIQIVNFVKTKQFPTHLFKKFCEEMETSIHKSLFLHTEGHWLTRGKVLTRLVELRKEVHKYFYPKDVFVKDLMDDKFVLRLTYLADIFSKLNELNSYSQGIEGDIFIVHDKIRSFMKKLLLWKEHIEKKNFDCFESFSNYISENQIEVDDIIIKSITDNLSTLKDNFDSYFLSEMEKYQKMKWISNPFQEQGMTDGLSIRAKEELIELCEDSLFKINFNRKKLISFWLSVQKTYPTISNIAVKMLLPFISSCNCEVGFSDMVAIETKLQNDNDNNNELILLNSLRVKLTNFKVDIDAVMKNKK